MTDYPNEKYPAYEFFIEDLYPIYQKVFEEWCEENCKGVYDISIKDYIENGMGLDITFTFVNEVDAMAFKLRWL